jgi:tetratricopeptide (TPR) repeat protein
MTGSAWRSALVAALFAWHPLRVESVAWVAERKDVLSTFFWLLTMMAYYLSGVQSPKSKVQGPGSKVCYGLALVCFALGLMSKPMVVTLPFVLLLLDWWPLRRIYDLQFTIYEPKNHATLGRVLLEKVPFFVLAGLAGGATVWAQQAGNSVVSAAALPVSDRVANALVSYVLYLGKTFWPVDLAVLYPYSHAWTFWQAAGAGALLLAITGAVLSQWRARPHLAVGWFWFLGTLVPVIGLVQVGLQSMADRYTYVPGIGLGIMVAWSIPEAWAKWPRPGLLMGTAAAAVLFLLLLATSLQLSYWHDSVALFGHTAAVTKDNILAEYNLGEGLARRGDEAGAVVHYLRALAIRPNRVEAQYNSQPQAHFNLGLIYRKHGMWREAEAQLREAVRADNHQAMPHYALGSVLLSGGRYAEAAREFEVTAKLAPDNAGAKYNLGLAREGGKDFAGAEREYRDCLGRNPADVEALNRLAWLLATQPAPELRNGTNAVALAERARDLTRGTDARILATLDAAFAEAGRFADAVSAVKRTSAAATAQGQTNLVAAAAGRLKLYEAGKPFRE